ncbi:hypothetical protein AGMMS49546_12390 [Spirochaetia bacterium]|nr:hypothetical protein AGMMS49546_12390 [Spirochaetia bacterium]
MKKVLLLILTMFFLFSCENPFVEDPFPYTASKSDPGSPAAEGSLVLFDRTVYIRTATLARYQHKLLKSTLKKNELFVGKTIIVYHVLLSALQAPWSYLTDPSLQSLPIVLPIDFSINDRLPDEKNEHTRIDFNLTGNNDKAFLLSRSGNLSSPSYNSPFADSLYDLIGDSDSTGFIGRYTGNPFSELKTIDECFFFAEFAGDYTIVARYVQVNPTNGEVVRELAKATIKFIVTD